MNQALTANADAAAPAPGPSLRARSALLKRLADVVCLPSSRVNAFERAMTADVLVDMLREKGFDIARRTVAKYREAMGIGSSVQRRRQKLLGSRAA